LIWTDHFHYLFRFQHKTRFISILLSYFQHHVLCDRQTAPKPRQTTSNICCVTSKKSEGFSLSRVYFCVYCLTVHSVLTKTYQFLWEDEAAVVSSPSDVLQHLSLAFRSDQTHLSLSRVPPYLEVPSQAVTYCVWEHRAVCVVQKAIMDYKNNINKHLEFKLYDEENNTINYLDISIHRNTNRFDLEIL